MQTTEKDLIDQSLALDTDAYGQLVDRYKVSIYHHCFAILRDEDAAEDVAQETFIAAYYKLNTFDDSRKFSTWLFKIATNKCLNELKKAKRTIGIDEEMIQTIVSPHKTAEELSADSEVHVAVARLKPEYRAIVEMHYFQAMNYEEIAEIMGRPVGSIKGWMSRAKRELRKELA